MKKRERKINLVTIEGVNIDLDQLAVDKVTKKAMIDDDLFFSHIKSAEKKQAAYDALWAKYSDKEVSQKAAAQVTITEPQPMKASQGLTEQK